MARRLGQYVPVWPGVVMLGVGVALVGVGEVLRRLPSI